VIVHQTQVFAGATMEFQGAWTTHPKFGHQFKASKAVERKPAAAADRLPYLMIDGLLKSFTGCGKRTPLGMLNITVTVI